ncbi:hypothetical protein P4645_08745 [Lysinibacillus fusiformis]|uniref:hypothetical protein n=1 Tax=Lysinibacillus fusiformis TaxID=28031 RepID=UPI0000F38F5C|nr:hypothetical protein [Lysinibacillus fusiformis]EAZ84560.1 hypothetical protein BB14905_21453 [Bacillus sp. B14905]MED4076333.1 hypothetical protein [Lysinibacillus fusiformis]
MYNYNPYYRYYLQNPSHIDLPSAEGDNWKGKNVDIELSTGRKICKVRFVDIEGVAGDPGTPIVYLWQFDDYNVPPGEPPHRIKFNPKDIIQITDAGELCKRSGSSNPNPNGSQRCEYVWHPILRQYVLVCF